jgi:AcrR family transcriptional regulator
MSRLTREENQLITRHRLRSAARSEFARRGVAAASVDRIAETAGFSRGAFYSNYASKRELLLELMSEEYEKEIAVWQMLIDQAANLETMLDALETRFDEFSSAPRDALLLAAEMRMEALRDPEFAKTYQQYSDNTLRKVEDLVRGLSAKAGRTDIDIEITAISLRAFSTGVAFERSYGLHGHSPGEAIVFFLCSMLGLPPAVRS